MQLHLQPRLQGTRKFQTRRALTPTLCRAAYTPPSSSTAQSELAWLETHSTVVQDTFETASAPGAATAATVSAKLLYNLSRSERLGLKPLQNALTTARTVDRNPEKQVERALVNVGAVLSTMVSGRVSTEVDPRLAHDKAALIAKAKTLAAMYKDLNIPANRLLFRLPATWQGVCAAKELEAEGINTQLVMVYSLIQGVAAAQAGASVITPRVGKTRDWFTKHPGVIRDPKGPRQDAGAAGGVDPGINLVTQLYNYIKVHHPKTQIMATGIRSREDALALSGCDFLLLPTPVISTLDALPTTAGYNDGLSAAQLDDDALTPALSPAKARAAAPEALPPVTEASFSDGLGYAGNELLSLSLAHALKEVDLLASMNRSTTGITST